MTDDAKHEPEAMRYGFDGFGYRYIDSGSGSDWRTRHPDAEPLYIQPQTDDRYGKIHTDGSRSGGQPLDDSTDEEALALMNDPDWPYEYELDDHPVKVLSRFIEQHEAFKQEVSDALLEYYGGYHNASGEPLERFIIPKPKPDPLAEAMLAIGVIPDANSLRAALEARGLEIREKGQ